MTLIIHIYSVLGMDPTVYQLACVCEVLFKSPVSVLQLMALTCKEPVDKDEVIKSLSVLAEYYEIVFIILCLI
jgi:hypothetical protein